MRAFLASIGAFGIAVIAAVFLIGMFGGYFVWNLITPDPVPVADTTSSAGSLAEAFTPEPKPDQNSTVAKVAEERNAAVATVTAQAALLAQQAAATPVVIVVTALPVPPTATPVPTATSFVVAAVTAAAEDFKVEESAASKTGTPRGGILSGVPRLSFTEQSTADAGNNGGGGQTTLSGLPGFESDRVWHSQDTSYPPEYPLGRPGYGTAANEIMTVVGHTLVFQTAQGEVIFDDGCQQAIVPPGVYAWNAGGDDWNYTGWYWDEFQTEWINEMAVMSYQLVQQQISWEDCPNRTAEERMAHVMVVEQDGKFVKLTPWSEWHRASGENHTIMFAPGDRVYGWHMGLGSAYTGIKGQNGQDNLCDGGGCYLPSAPTFGWCGGCVVNSTWPGEIPSDAVAIPQSKIDAVMATLPE